MAVALLCAYVLYLESPLVQGKRTAMITPAVEPVEQAAPSASATAGAGPVVEPEVSAEQAPVARTRGERRSASRGELVALASEHGVAPGHLSALNQQLREAESLESLAPRLAREQQFFAMADLKGELAIESLLLGRTEVVKAVNAAHASGLPWPYTLEQHQRLLPSTLARRVGEALAVLARARLGHLAWPAGQSTRITSAFGERVHPLGGGKRLHEGIDLSMPVGTEVRAVLAGRVTRVGQDRVAGRFLRLSHGYGIESVYCHLDRVEVSQHDAVEVGQVVARSGNTGRSTGPHLHYALLLHGRAVDPVPWHRRSFGSETR
jgi:murein DD-endopeptidase MepM/ murein hydrolase activator NlpD